MNSPKCDKCGQPLEKDKFETFIEVDDRISTEVNICSACVEKLDNLIKKILEGLK